MPNGSRKGLRSGTPQMLDAYFDAFDDFLASGSTERLAEFTERGANPAFLSVYRNGYLKTCTDALGASYPVVRALVGEDCFRGLARAYVDTHPPTSGTLVGYGGAFAMFLTACANEHGLAYLADAALLDAAWLASFFAADGEPLAPADVEAMGTGGTEVAALAVTLTPPTQVVALDHDIVATWTGLREHGSLQSHVELGLGQHTALLWRLNGQISIRALQPGEAAFLSALAGVSTLEAAAGQAFAVDAAFDLAQTFAALLQNQVLQLEGPKE